MYKELQNIILQTKKKFFSKLHGEHLSIFNGNGLDFNEVKEYTIDDDIRHINWKITARTRNPNVNLFFDHKKIEMSVIYLNSGGLILGKNTSKQSVAIKILSCLSYLSINSKDNLSTLFFDSKVKKFFPPTNDKYTTYRIYEYAKELEPKGNQINYKKLQETILEHIRPRTVLFFIGDFLELPDFTKLQTNYEIYTCIIRDKGEEELDFQGENTLIDTNSMKKHNITLTKKTIKDYNDYMKNYDKRLYEIFSEQNINYTKFYTNEDTLSKFRDFLRRIDGK